MFSVRRLLATFKAFCDKEMSVTGIKSGQLDSLRLAVGEGMCSPCWPSKKRC